MYEHVYPHDEHREHAVLIPDEYHRCEYCEHWRGDYFNQVHAVDLKNLLFVGQCVAEGDDAPGVAGVDGFVFTQPHQRCRAFSIRPDTLAVLLSDRAVYARMERERWTA